MRKINLMTIEELMRVFDVIFDAQEHPIFHDAHGFHNEDAFDGYDEAFGCWIAYELMNMEVAA